MLRQRINGGNACVQCIAGIANTDVRLHGGMIDRPFNSSLSSPKPGRRFVSDRGRPCRCRSRNRIPPIRLSLQTAGLIA